MSEPFLGQIQSVGFNFAPRGWSTCHGQLLPIAQNSALFSLFGTMYGGDGRTTFGLPDLRGRIPLNAGQGPGLPNYRQGSTGGSYEQNITTLQMPSHTHAVLGASVEPLCNSGNTGVTDEPTEGYMANGGQNIYSGSNDGEKMAAQPVSVTLGNTGGSQPLYVQNPYQTILWVVALVGLYPSRS